MRLRIVQPCHEDWDAMQPAGQGRFCEVCTHPVHDFASMTERQARQLLAARAGERLCVRVRVGADGHAVFRGEPPRVAATAAALALAACAPHSPEAERLDGTEEVEVAAPAVPRTIEIPEAPPQVLPQVLPAKPVEPPPPPKAAKRKPKPRFDDEVIDVGYLDSWD